LRQHVSTRGIDQLALDVTATDASKLGNSPHRQRDQFLSQLLEGLHRQVDNASLGFRTLIIIDHADEATKGQLVEALRDLACRSRVTILVASRAPLSRSLQHTFRRDYEKAAGLATCAKRALLHAGQVGEIMADDAVNLLAQHASGRYDLLAGLVHQCLCWGYQNRLRLIDGKRMRRFLTQYERESKISSQVEAEGPVIAAAA